MRKSRFTEERIRPEDGPAGHCQAITNLRLKLRVLSDRHWPIS